MSQKTLNTSKQSSKCNTQDLSSQLLGSSNQPAYPEIAMYNQVPVCCFCSQFFNPDCPDGIDPPHMELSNVSLQTPVIHMCDMLVELVDIVRFAALNIIRIFVEKMFFYDQIILLCN